MPQVHRLAAGSTVPDDIVAIASGSGMECAAVEGIGGVDELTIAYYNHQTKKYEEHHFNEFLEVTSLIGNVTVKEGKLFLHAHGTFGRKDLSVVGGHVMSARVYPTLEMVFTELENKAVREFDEESGLFLIR